MPKIQQKAMVFGATGGTGLAVVDALKSAGAQVVAVARSTSNTSALEQLGVEVVYADAMDRQALQNVFAGVTQATAVVSALGGKFDEVDPADFEGNRNIVDAAEHAGVKRFVLITSVGAGDSRVALPANLLPILGPRAELKTKAEEHLRNSTLCYTIIRPGHLTDQPASGNGFLTEDVNVLSPVARADLAQLVVDCLAFTKAEFKVLSAGDTGMLSSEKAPIIFDLHENELSASRSGERASS